MALKVRFFIWSFLLTVMWVFVFAEFATPIVKQKSVANTLPIHKTLYLERDIDEDETLYISQAVEEWNEVTNGQVVFDIKRLPQPDLIPSDSIVIINVSEDYPDIILLDNAKGFYTLGYYDGDRSLAYIALVSNRISGYSFKQVVLHELGHSLGLDHVEGIEGVGTLMYPTIDLGSTHITDSDLEHFCKLYHCDSSKFHGFAQVQ